jgi:AraC-like DNA-binding protein
MELRLLDSAAVRLGAADRSFVTQLELHTDRPKVAGAGARARFWRPFPRKGADIVCGEATVSEVPFHAHEAVQVLLPLSPFAVVGGTGGTTVLHPGTIHVTGPLELRAARSLDGAAFSTRIILVAPSVLAAIHPVRASHAHVATRQMGPQAAETAPRLTELVVRDHDLYAALMRLFDALRRPLTALNCESRALESLAQLLGRDADPSAVLTERGRRPPGGVVRARDYLRAQPVQNVALDELATISRLSKFYLLRSFYRAYGLTPHGYQMQLRLARARRLLDEGRPLSHVTYDAGFADQSHLTRRFAEFYGLTPARYARQLGTHPGAAPDLTTSASRAATPPSAA